MKIETVYLRGKMKQSGLRIRVEPELCEEFTEAFKRLHVPVAQVLRKNMRAVNRLLARTGRVS